MVKTSQIWLTHLLFATPQAPRLGLVGAVSLHNTIMASNMILNTSQTTSKAEKWFLGGFKCKLGAKCDKNIQKLPDALKFGYFTSTPVGLVGTLSLQNSAMASNMILNTTYNTQQAKKMIFKCF